MVVLSREFDTITDLPTGVGCDGATFDPATMEAFHSRAMLQPW